MVRLSVQKGKIEKKLSCFFIFLVPLLLIPGLCQASTTVLTSASPDHTVISGTEETIFGTSTSNRITIESGAKAELINFPGQNVIEIQADLNGFTVSRSGTVVAFEGADGTVLKIPASTSVQTIAFSDREPLTLSIYQGQVMLDDQVVTTTAAAIDEGPGNVNTLPFSDTVNRPANINPGTVITTENHGLWVVTEGSYYAGTQRSETAYFYEENNHIKMSYMDSGVSFTVALIEGDSENPNNFPFSDTVNRPANINPDTVITTENHGMWIITEGSYYAGTQRLEDAYFYEENNDVRISYMDCGVSFSVVEMPDTAPVRSSTMRPANMNPGTILILDNGQVWKITEGSYYGGTTKREDVIIYSMNGNYHMSFQICGVTMKVEQIITN